LHCAYDGLDGKKQLFNILEDHVCTDCTRTFCFSFVSVPTQKLDLYRCGTMQQAFAGGRHRAYESPRRNIQKFTEPNLAKVGVEGSNPFARSRLSKPIQRVKNGPSGLRLLRVVLGACILSGFYAPGRKLWDTPSQARRHTCLNRSASRQHRRSSELPYKTRNVETPFERSSMRLSASIPAATFPAGSR
jgi:hypothetical protein